MDSSEDHDMNNSERNEQNEMKLQAQLVASVLPEYDIIELPGPSTTVSSPSSAMSGSCTSATSLNSSSSTSSLIANLRDVDTTMKLGCRPTSAANNLMSTNFPADLRRTQYEQSDSEHVAIPKICVGVNCPEKLVSSSSRNSNCCSLTASQSLKDIPLMTIPVLLRLSCYSSHCFV